VHLITFEENTLQRIHSYCSGALTLTWAKIILTALFLLNLLFSFGQQDSLLTVINHPPSVSKKILALASLSFDLSYSNPDSSMLLANEGLTLSKKIKNDTCFAHCYMAAGWCYFCVNKRDSAEIFLSKASELFHEIKQISNEAKCLLDLCYVYDANKDYVKLLSCLRKVRPLKEAEKNEKSLANIDLLMGRAYGEMGLFADGKKYLRQGINTIKKINQTDYLPTAYLSYGRLLMKENNDDSAFYYYRMCYAISKQLDPSDEASTADNLGEIFLKKYQKENCAACIDSAFQYYQHALYLYTKMNSTADIQNEHINMGKVLRAKERYKLRENILRLHLIILIQPTIWFLPLKLPMN
jgi:tetratricopeptide (TPR) repeat protein